MTRGTGSRMSGSETVMHPSHSHSFVLRNACREPVPRVITLLYNTLHIANTQVELNSNAY